MISVFLSNLCVFIVSLTKIVLVGKTGTGKSSSGNTIIGDKHFIAATRSTSVTQKCRKETGQVAGRNIMLVDTPGLFDTGLSEDELKKEISKCINMTAPGPHAIILVIQLGPFTEEERLSVEKIRAIFGKQADKYTMILFTHGDIITGTIEEYVENAQKDLRQMIHQCGERYHVFDNTNMQDRSQVLEFLEKVDKMVDANGGECYSSNLYREVEKLLKEKEEELKSFYEQKLQEQKTDLESKFNAEKRKLEETIEKLKESSEEKGKKIKELELLEKQKSVHIIEYERYYHSKIAVIKHEAEQTQFGDMSDILNKLNNVKI